MINYFILIIEFLDPGGKDPSDVSLQSFPDDQNNSIVFTGDEMSNTENDISPSEQNSPPPATSGSIFKFIFKIIQGS